MKEIGRVNFSKRSQYQLYVYYTNTGQSVWNNRSVVNVEAWIYKSSGSGYWSNDPSRTDITINGHTSRSNYPSYDFSDKTWMAIGTYSAQVNHNLDGSKSVAIEVDANFDTVGGANIGRAIFNGSVTLTKFDRVGVLGPLPSTMHPNNAVEIPYTVKSAGLSHDIIAETTSSAHYQRDRFIGDSGSYNFGLGSAAINDLYNAMHGTGGTTLRYTLATRNSAGDSTLGYSKKDVTALPLAPHFTKSATSLTLGESLTAYFTKHHTDAGFRYGFCRSGNGAWLPGYPLTTTDSSASLSTSSESFKKSVMQINQNSRSITVGSWVEQRNSGNYALGWTEQPVTFTIPQTYVDFSGTAYMRSIEFSAWSSGTIVTPLYYQCSFNGGPWTDVGTTYRVTGLNPGQWYSMRYCLRQDSSNIWVYSETKYFVTQSVVAMTVNRSTAVIDEPFTITTTRPSGITGSLWVEDSNGSTIAELGRKDSGNTVVSFGYDKLGAPGINQSNYSKVVKVFYQGVDAVGDYHTVTRNVTYTGIPLPSSATNPSKTTSKGYVNVLLYGMQTHMTADFRVVRVIDGATIMDTKSISYNSDTYHFKETDFADYFSTNDSINFRIYVQAYYKGYKIYETNSLINVDPDIETLVRVAGSWVKPSSIYRMIGSIQGIIPGDPNGNYPNEELYLKLPKASSKDLASAVFVYNGQQWVKAL